MASLTDIDAAASAASTAAVTCHSWAKSPTTLGLLTGLLASNCCVIQLVLNLFGTGCAGFRKLEAYKPVWLALNAVALARCWCADGGGSCGHMSCGSSAAAASSACCHNSAAAAISSGPLGALRSRAMALTHGRWRKLAITLFCLSLTFSEDALRAWNNRGVRRGGKPPRLPSESSPAAPTLDAAVCAAEARHGVTLQANEGERVHERVDAVHLTIGGMRCEGCRRGVISALAAVPGVITVTVSMAGTAAIVLHAHANREDTIRQAVDAVAMAGFSATSTPL
eukprot:TRINITY_DN3243_c0_g1_i1.p1 TRINITY_DN3243_c0_g1~~TRINITY_DN3243_c0_g1_i1.p1  ORF type:complete len:282 (+),score=72.16 TRINITY_DN3243_c0_g1_i1:90-935(+)